MMVGDRFGMTSAVVVRDRDELASEIADNPFAGTNEDRFVHTMFLSDQPGQPQFDRMVGDPLGRGGAKPRPGKRQWFLDNGEVVAQHPLTAPSTQRRFGWK